MEKPSNKRSRRVAILRSIVTAGLMLAWLGLICRGRDSWVVPAVIYYATPWLLRGCAGLLALVVLKHWGLRLMAATCLLVSGLEGWHSFHLDTKPEIPAGALHAAIYNSGRTLESKPKTWPVLAETDITAVVESGDFTAEKWIEFSTATAGMTWQQFGGTMLGVRGKILSWESLGVWPFYKCYRCRVSLPAQGEFIVVVVDIESQPWRPREKTMAGILAAAQGDPKAIILGDFNTPPETRWCRPWHETLSLANDSPHRGFRETWCYGIPLLTLDQIWLGKGWQAIWTEHSRHGSDHSRVRAVLRPAG
jgi:endonuclease/exonuclease/phosphatase family metal-dependent hydrolase